MCIVETAANTGYTAQPLRGFAQICPNGQTSYSPKTLGEISPKKEE
jgi:hypothetical protein